MMNIVNEQYDLELEKLPEHVAIIMDGNGRWAQSRGLPRAAGHRAGVEALRGIIRMSSDIGVKVLTLYAFSSENWKRPKNEVNVLMQLLVEFLYKEIDELDKEKVHIRFMGDIRKFPHSCKKAIEYAVNKTRYNTGLTVNIALGYGGRAELVGAFKAMHAAILSGELKADDIDEQSISRYLYTSGLPDPDLIIRTSGEMRLSNFMLYQSSYSELYVPEVYWPDFDNDEYKKALVEFSRRKRRYGGLSDKETK